MKRVIILTLILLISLPAAAQQKPPEPVELLEPVPYMALGLAFPLIPSDYTDLWVLGMHGSVGLDRPISDKYYINYDIMISYHGLDKNGYRDKHDLDWNIFNPLDGEVTLIFATVNLKRKFPKTPIGRGYVVGGGGPMAYRRAKIDVRMADQFFETVEAENSFGFGLDVGIGWEFKATRKWGFFFEHRYYTGTVEDMITDMSIKFGARFVSF